MDALTPGISKQAGNVACSSTTVPSAETNPSAGERISISAHASSTQLTARSASPGGAMSAASASADCNRSGSSARETARANIKSPETWTMGTPKKSFSNPKKSFSNQSILLFYLFFLLT
jgi:hypothetical protein